MRSSASEEEEVKYDGDWQQEMKELSACIEQTYFIQIYFNSLTQADKYKGKGKYADIQIKCEQIIRDIYTEIVALIVYTDAEGKLQPSSHLKFPIKIAAKILLTILSKKMQSMFIEQRAREDSPDVILKKTLRFMLIYLRRLPMDEEKDQVTTSFWCFFKKKPDPVRYSDFKKKCIDLKSTANGIFKFKKLKQACELLARVREQPDLLYPSSLSVIEIPPPPPPTPEPTPRQQNLAFQRLKDFKEEIKPPLKRPNSARREHMEWRLKADHAELKDFLEVKERREKLERAKTQAQLPSQKVKKPLLIKRVSWDVADEKPRVKK